MTSHEENRAALIREREARQTAYLAAVAERDALPGDRRAEARFGLAIQALEFWGDPIPTKPATTAITAPATPLAPLRPHAGAVSQPLSEADRLANEIIAAAESAVAPAPKNDADRLADEIIACARLANADEDDEVDAIARRIAAA